MESTRDSKRMRIAALYRKKLEKCKQQIKLAVSSNLKEFIGLDTRSLALFRVLLAYTILWDLSDRWRDLKHHYTDEGVFPRHTMISALYNPYWLSIHIASGSYYYQLLLFLLHIVAATSLLVGYRTRLSVFVTW